MKSTTNNIEAEAANDIMCCAPCGTACNLVKYKKHRPKHEADDMNLEECDACDLVKYCSLKCQEDHRPKHEATRKKRAAELRDEILFRQPESSDLGDCPICFLPLPLDGKKSTLQTCCCKKICKGCAYANRLRELEQKLQQTCPFCRHPPPETQEEANRNLKKRVAANDPVAIREEGKAHFQKGDYSGAFEYWTKAAELGDMAAHYELSILYQKEQGVEKDEENETYHLEEAAIAGHVEARNNLAVYEWRNKRYERAVKHWIIAANLGDDGSIQALKQCYVDGHVSKEEFAAALRAHQAAVDATKKSTEGGSSKFHAV